MPKAQNIVNYTIFTRGQYQKIMKNLPKIDQKTPNKDFQYSSSNFTLFFPTPNPQKRENPSRLKDFRGGSAAGARPRVAKAMLSFHHYTARHRRIKGLRPLPPTPGHWRVISIEKQCGRTVSQSQNTMAVKYGSGPRPAAHTAKRCFLNCLETSLRPSIRPPSCTASKAPLKGRSRRAKTPWQWSTDRARGQQPILPNVAFWTA